MYRFTRIITALVIAVSVMSFVPASASPSQAGAMQTYIVLYAGQAVPADVEQPFAVRLVPRRSLMDPLGLEPKHQLPLRAT